MTATTVTRYGALGAVALLLAGCTTVMDGSATRDPGYVPGQVNTALLQPGNYPTSPRTPESPSEGLSKLVEAQRLAGYVIYPWEVDPGFTAQDMFGIMVMVTPNGLSKQITGASTLNIAANNGFINGFSTSRSTPKKTPGKHSNLNPMVLRFPDPARAAAAEAAFVTQNQNGAEGSTGAHPIAIPGHPEAAGTAAVLSSNGNPSVTAFSVHGPYVLYVFTQTDDTAESAAALIGKTLDLQGPRIDQFVPTDPTQFPTMNPDPDGLIARSLPFGESMLNYGVYTASGAMHFVAGDDNPQGAVDSFTTAGIDRWVDGGHIALYRAKDVAAAAGFAEFLAKQMAEDADPKPTIPGFPTARCFTNKKPDTFDENVNCVATADRFACTVTTKRSIDAVQRVSAQYLMLTSQ